MVPSSAPDNTDDRSRGGRKRAAILEAAQEAFFANGFIGTSMDQVAAKAAVSKQTVYKHFSDKETLFREVVTQVVRAGDGGIPPNLFLEGEGSIEDRLKSFSSSFLRGVLQPDVIKLRRLLIGEAGRFPELGRIFYELGPQRATDQLAIALGAAADRHDLMMNDPEVAAGHLLSLILSKPLDEAMLLGDGFRCTEASLLKVTDEGVRAFLGVYGSSQH